ncbi:MAG: DEAD/DEAH box helicase-like protein [archaeon GW2011_AR17]|nr:MAG: DEAD/DEAH box helicase-like protein [archaeon GW2011_AR17]MBS3154551.1 DEAD/DEAH box helicase [Candidatus Woesearchaeota archaeon]
MLVEELNLNHNILKAIKALGYVEATQIQAKCIPEIKAGKDVVGQSSTGSGKTAAFGLPLLEKVENGKGLQILILTPTRELCVQVSDAIYSFSKFIGTRIVSVYGGVSIGPQIHAIQRADVVVGTPGRILDHLERRTINFDKVKILVLDEADKMFEMGFIEDVERIMKHIPKERQTLLFSATLSSSIQQLVQRYLRHPVTVKAEVHVAKHLLKQRYYVVRQHEKFSLLMMLLKQNPSGMGIVFCATRRGVDSVTKNLRTQGVKAMAIHGGLTQSKRMYALDNLKKESINILVATDVAARGLDIKNVSHIYNYDVPKTADEYVHRIGRTARAGAEGDAITLLSDHDFDNFNHVLSDRSLTIKKEELPSFEKVAFQKQERDFDNRRPGQGSGRGGFGRGPSSGGFGGRPSPGARGRSDERRGPSFGRKKGPVFGRR